MSTTNYRQVEGGEAAFPPSPKGDGLHAAIHMKRLMLMLATGVVLAAISAPTADAETFECQVTEVLIVVAVNGPVTVCAIDTTTSDPVTANLTVSPHLFTPAPPPEPGP